MIRKAHLYIVKSHMYIAICIRDEMESSKLHGLAPGLKGQYYPRAYIYPANDIVRAISCKSPSERPRMVQTTFQ
jgi:hypothetical protein